VLVRASEANVRGTFTTIVGDGANDYGNYSAVGLTSDGGPVVAYTDDTNGTLR
jgi:hypothetical protein